MAGEPRRSGRATKGQHTKNQELEAAPAPPQKRERKSKKSKASEEPSDDEDDSIIRCICGATEDDDGWMMISCEKCTAWQHNLCMGITEDPDKLPEKYFCEQCRPQDHKELLAAMARGEKPWEERIARREEEEKAKSKKGKKGGKAKGGRQSAAEPESTSKAKSSTPDKAVPTTEPGVKRKFEAVEVTNGHGAQKPTISTVVPSESKRSKSESGSARRGSVASPILPRAETFDQLTRERESVAKALSNELRSLTQKAIKDGNYKLKANDTADSVGTNLGLSIEHAMHYKHRATQNSTTNPYLEHFRTLRFNLKKNEALIRRILSGSLTPEALVDMSSEELASDELQKERAAIKEEVEKQVTLTHEVGPRYRKTHKGEEIVEDTTHKPAEEYRAAPVRRGTIEQHNDVPIDTGSPPPGTELPDFEESEDMGDSRSRETSSARPRISTSDVVMRDAADDPELDQLLKDDDGSQPVPQTLGPKAGFVWNGSLSMNGVGVMNGSGRLVAGTDLGEILTYAELLGQALEIDGRIAIDRADKYVGEMRNHAHTTVVCILSLVPNDTAEDRKGFEALWSYFTGRQRWGVVAQRRHDAIRDIYFVPADGKVAPIPKFLDTVENNKIPNPLQERLLLMAIVARKRPLVTPSQSISVGASIAQTPVNTNNPQFSPVTVGLPFGMAPPHAQSPNPLPAGDGNTLAHQILGPYYDCPVVHQILTSVGSMSEVQLQNLRDILQREPATRDDISQLSEHLLQRQKELAGA